MEVLNLTSQYLTMGFFQKIPNLVDILPKYRKKLNLFICRSDSSFNVNPIAFMCDVVNAYEPERVLIDDRTNVPGLIETLNHDLGIPVVLDSDSRKGLFLYEPGQPEKILTATIH